MMPLEQLARAIYNAQKGHTGSYDPWLEWETPESRGWWIEAAQVAHALVAEECAKVCERQASLQVDTGGSDDAVNQALRCARDIRAQVPPESAVSQR